MPPKQRITKEMLLSHAFTIVKEQGISAVTSRSVAKSIGCSIQPVFSQFPTMEELRQATFEYACSKLMKEILEFQNEPDFMTRTNLWLLSLARNEPRLFELLYLSDSFNSINLWDVMMDWECNRKILSAFEQRYQLTKTESKDIFQRGFFILFGIATMISKGKIDISNDESIDMVQRTVSQMVTAKTMKGGKV